MFTNDILLKTIQFVKSVYREDEIRNKTFLMLGKQEMHLHEAFLDILDEAGLIGDKTKFGERELEDSVLFFKALGFKEVHSLDVSDYEKADIIFNLNDDLPRDLEGKFDMVFDGGVIEHVFNVANAFLNICKLTKVNGYIFNLNPVYNYIHNTFWNISPEMFLEFYTANNYKVLDCSLLTYLAEDEEKRAWPDRPVIWSPDVRLMNLMEGGGLCAGKHIRSLNKLCSNPHPETWIVAQKTHSEEFIYPIVSGYAKKHRGEKEDHAKKTWKVRIKYDISKIIQWVESKENVDLYCVGKSYEIIMKALYEKGLESRIRNVFDSDIGKFGSYKMGKYVNYLNCNTYSKDDDILICTEKHTEEVYKQLCDCGVEQEKIYRLSDSIFAKNI